MAAPHVIIPRLEGLAGYIAGTGTVEGQDGAYLWIELMKQIMHAPQNRGLTTFEFDWATDVDESGNLVYTGAAWVLGIMYRTTAAAVDVLLMTDNTSNTQDAAAAWDADDMFACEMELAAGTYRLGAFAFPMGIYMGTGIVLASDAQGGTSPAADDNDAFILYRTA